MKSKLLILDLDETLIFASAQLLDSSPFDFRVGPYYLYERPSLRPFLKTCLEWFDVAIWTSSSPTYASEIVSALFKEDEKNLVFVWASDRCTLAFDPECCEHYWRKNLIKVRRRSQRKLESVIVVDDTPEKWEQSYGNLIRVTPFEGDTADDELVHLLRYLDTLRHEENIRTVEKRNWRQQTHK